MNTTDVIFLAAAVLILVSGIFWFRDANRKYKAEPTKKGKRIRILSIAVLCAGAYLTVTRIITPLFGKNGGEHEFTVELWPERHEIFGYSISETVINTWIVMAVILILALILRFTVLRRLEDVPKGMQNALEFAVEKILGYMDSNAHKLGDTMGSYIFSVAVLLVGCAVSEMFGARTPASDITFTAGLSLITFFLINWYGIRRKGVGGRIKSMMKPTLLVLPVKIVTDLAIPVSLACRMFGNMLGGLIIMDLVYFALGNGAAGIPSVIGLFFNVFHPLLQAFIFITLSLIFIGEAVE